MPRFYFFHLRKNIGSKINERKTSHGPKKNRALLYKNCSTGTGHQATTQHESVCQSVSESVSQWVSSVIQSCLTLCDPMNRSTPGLPVRHQLPEFTQTHVHWVGDAIRPSHALSSPSPPAPNPSQHQGLFQWVSSLHEAAKVLEFQLQHQSFQWTSRTQQHE